MSLRIVSPVSFEAYDMLVAFDPLAGQVDPELRAAIIERQFDVARKTIAWLDEDDYPIVAGAFIEYAPGALECCFSCHPVLGRRLLEWLRSAQLTLPGFLHSWSCRVRTGDRRSPGAIMARRLRFAEIEPGLWQRSF